MASGKKTLEIFKEAFKRKLQFAVLTCSKVTIEALEKGVKYVQS